MIGLVCFALAVLTSPFKSKLRLEAAPTSNTAASIYYALETSNYAGGGVTVTW